MTEKEVTPTPITEGTSTFLQAPPHKGIRKLSDNASSIHSEENQSNSGNERQECSSDDGYKSSNEHTPFRSKRNSILSLGDKHSSDAHSFGEENTMTKEFSDSLTQPTCTTVSDAQDTTKERSRPVPIVTKMDANTNHTCTLSPTHLSHNYCVEHSSIPILVDTSNGSVSESGSLDTNHRTPFVSSPGLDVSSSSSIGGHHLSINLGDRFLKQADSRREEQFYATIAPYQGVLVESAVRQADHTIAVWSGEEVPPRESTESNTREDHLMRLFRFSEQQSTQEYRSYVSLYCSCDTTEEEAPLPSEEDRSYYNSVSHSELEKVRLAASLWWNRQWEGPVPMLGKCFHDDLSAPCSVHGDLIEQLNPSTPHTGCSNATQVFSEHYSRGGFDLDECRKAGEEKATALSLLCPFVPRFFGLRVMTLEELRRVAGRAVADTDPLHRYPHDADNEGEEIPIQLIVLEDVCHGFSYPCVMDMKIGSRQYGLNASERKKKSKNFKARTTCSWEYGIRLAGLRRWDEGQQAFTTKSKLQCRSLTLNEIKDEMTLFFKESRQLELIFVRQLQRLREAFQRQTVYRFYTSSLLFVFDAAAPVQTARIVMVDFAYTYERKELIEANDEDAQYDYDINYIKAIDTLLSLLS